MMFVRHNTLTYIRKPSVQQRKQTRLGNQLRLRNRGTLEDLVCGRVNPRAVVRILRFSARRCKTTASRIAAAFYNRASVEDRRWAFATHHITMSERTYENNDESSPERGYLQGGCSGGYRAREAHLYTPPERPQEWLYLQTFSSGRKGVHSLARTTPRSDPLVRESQQQEVAA